MALSPSGGGCGWLVCRVALGRPHHLVPASEDVGAGAGPCEEEEEEDSGTTPPPPPPRSPGFGGLRVLSRPGPRSAGSHVAAAPWWRPATLPVPLERLSRALSRALAAGGSGRSPEPHGWVSPQPSPRRCLAPDGTGAATPVVAARARDHGLWCRWCRAPGA